MKHMKVWAESITGLLIVFLVMSARGAFKAEKTAEVVMAVGDGFTVAAFLYLGTGALVWVASTGWFDIFGFAVKRGIHAILPNFFPEETDGYYEYKVKKAEKRKEFTEYLALKLGGIFLLISLLLTLVWYGF